MWHHKHFKLAAIAALLVACSDTAGPDGNDPGRTETFDWNGQIAPGQVVEIENLNGDIRASRAGGRVVRVVALKRGDKDHPSTVRIEVLETEDGVTVCALYPDVPGQPPNECRPGLEGQQSSWRNDVEVTFDVEVPAGSDFIGRTLAGAVEATGLDGDVTARSLAGDVDISTSGLAEATTFQGNITASFGRAVPDRDIVFSSLSGHVAVRVPANLSAEVWGATGNGSISTDFPLGITRLGVGRQMRGTLGAGGYALRLTTFEGDIALRSN